MVRRTSVPTCPLPSPARSGMEHLRRIPYKEAVAVYVTALVYVLFDLCVFHVLSAWLMAIVELLEIAPIAVGAWFYWRATRRRAGRMGGIPRLLYVPVISTSVQVQILLVAGIYRHLGVS